ncbi:MAG: hypothetical protein JWQ71_4998 [Pedosphaera sp.]|nr:hypothetical protein [Pedosphaera sp.]
MTSFNHFRSANYISFISCLLALACLPLKADILELINGDHYSGNVISMTPTNLEFRSDIQGLVKIPRDKVASISLRPSVIAKPVAKPATAQPSAPAAPSATASNTPSSAVIQQMRQEGVDPKMMDQIQKQLMGTSSPEASKMFNDLVGGLSTGSLSVQDIRSQAQKAIKDIQSAKKDLGGDSAELLDGYAAILQKFVNETETPANTNPPAPKPGAQTPAAP